jgi:hypothetical protein
MPPVSGQITTLNLDQTLRRIDMRQGLLRLQPDAAPITVLTGKIGSKPTFNPQFQWSQKDLPIYADSVNGAIADGVITTIVVANGTVFWVGDTVKVPSTGEVFRVTAVATNTLTVVRGLGGGAAAIANSAELIRLGTAMEEGDVSPTPRMENPTLVSNYTQIFKTSWRMSNTARPAQQLNGEDKWNETAFDKGIEHKRDIELAFLFGKPSEINTGTGPRRSTGGALNFISTNVTDAAGVLSTTTHLNPLIRNIFRYAGKDELVGMSSDFVLDVINNFAVGKLQLIQSDTDKVYGLQIMAYQTPNGILRFTPHRLLSESPFYKSHAIFLDYGLVRRRHLEGRDTAIQNEIQPPNADYKESQYLTETGLEFGLERRHGVLKGVTG